MNTLYYGDNLDVLRRYLKDETVDLVYLDPPFNSKATYNVLFSDHDGTKSASGLKAFKDTWTWAEAAETYQSLILEQGPVGKAMRAFGDLLPEGGLLAYLVMMAPRLAELRRVLKPTGSLYLHCDPTASHYLKVLLDAVFGPMNYRNEIVWKRQSAHSDAKLKFCDVADMILFYAKSDSAPFSPQYTGHDPAYVERFYRFDDDDGRGRYRHGDMASPNPRPNMTYEWKGFPPPAKGWRYQRETMAGLDAEGRIHYPTRQDGSMDTTRRPALKRYLNEQQGSIVTNVWTDITSLHSSSAERLGYPTQKPEALLERIIRASCPEGGLVLDPFCGCGTTISAAERLGRPWIGIDITQAAIRTIKERLADTFGESVQYQVIGEPTTVEDAARLAEESPYQFQWWSLGLVGARPTEQKKGADHGIDGRLYFTDSEGGKARSIILSVKSGQHTGVAHVNELIGVLQQQGAEMGVLITLAEHTGPMRAAAVAAGFYEPPGWGRRFPKVQLLTVGALLAGDKRIEMPAEGQGNITYKKAPKANRRLRDETVDMFEK